MSDTDPFAAPPDAPVHGVPAGGVVTKPVLMYNGESDTGWIPSPDHKDPDVIAGIAAMLQEGLDRA